MSNLRCERRKEQRSYVCKMLPSFAHHFRVISSPASSMSDSMRPNPEAAARGLSMWCLAKQSLQRNLASEKKNMMPWGEFDLHICSFMAKTNHDSIDSLAVKNWLHVLFLISIQDKFRPMNGLWNSLWWLILSSPWDCKGGIPVQGNLERDQNSGSITY